MTYEEMYPCRAQIIRTKAQRDNAPLDEYCYPTDSVSLFTTATTIPSYSKHLKKL